MAGLQSESGKGKGECSWARVKDLPLVLTATKPTLNSNGLHQAGP